MIKETNSPGESSTTRFSNRKRLTWACRSRACVRRNGGTQGWTGDGRTKSRKKPGKRERKAAEMGSQAPTLKSPVWRVPGLPRVPWTSSRKKEGRSSGTTVLLAERKEKMTERGAVGRTIAWISAPPIPYMHVPSPLPTSFSFPRHSRREQKVDETAPGPCVLHELLRSSKIGQIYVVHHQTPLLPSQAFHPNGARAVVELFKNCALPQS